MYQLRVPTAACTNCLYQLHAPTACTNCVYQFCVYQLPAPTARLAPLVCYSSRFEISLGLGCTGNYPLIIDRGNPSYLSHICSRVAGIKLVPDILAAYSCAGKRPFLATPLGRGSITLKYLADSQSREALSRTCSSLLSRGLSFSCNLTLSHNALVWKPFFRPL